MKSMFEWWHYQISQVLDFTSNSFLQLNPTKCEIVSFAQRNNIDNPVCEIEGNVLTASGTAKCLSYLWNHDLSAKPSIDHNIMKATEATEMVLQHPSLHCDWAGVC